MEFTDSPDEAAFREEAADFIARTLPGLPIKRVESREDKVRNARWWQEQIAAAGYMGITYPVEYGGRGMSIVYEAIFNEESARQDAPWPINLLGMLLAGPTIVVHGSEEQKRRFLPKILSGEDVWCQGFSEPGAGSDLAGLRTRAVQDGDGWIVSGQKVWTSFAHAANRCMLLARTSGAGGEGKHAGITYFLADMDGIEVRPLVMINGEADFNEMFLDDVHVPDDRVLGTVGGGWPAALTTLAFERGFLAFSLAALAQRVFQRLVGRVRDAGAAEDPVVLAELGRLHADSAALRLSTIRQMSAVQAGAAPSASGSAVKLAWAQTMQAMTRLAVELGGVGLDDDSDRTWLHGYLRARGNSIEGGTDEVQRSIIAERVLGLPRSR